MLLVSINLLKKIIKLNDNYKGKYKNKAIKVVLKNYNKINIDLKEPNISNRIS